MAQKVEIVPLKDQPNVRNKIQHCWWHGEERSQNISCRGIDLVVVDYSGLST